MGYDKSGIEWWLQVLDLVRDCLSSDLSSSIHRVILLLNLPVASFPHL